MQFKSISEIMKGIPFSIRIGTIAICWLILISGLHYKLNIEKEVRKIVKMGYMPVITNIAAPLLDEASKDGKGVRFQAIKYASFAELGESLRNGFIHAAFIIAPLSIVLRQQGEDVKIVYIGNRHESTMVVRKDLNIRQLSDLAGKTFAVPMRFSGHHLCILNLMEKNGLSGQIRVLELNPPDMPSAMAVGSLDAYFVGEPFAAQSVKNGYANVLYYVEEVWQYFICNLMIVHQKFISSDPDTVQLLVQSAARSGYWAKNHIKEASEIAARFWNQKPDLVEYAMTTPNSNRILFDRFVPKHEEIQQMANMMHHFGLTKHSDISGLVEDRFAKNAYLENITDLKSILKTR